MTQQKRIDKENDAKQMVFKSLMIRMRNIALHNTERIDLRTLLILQHLGLYENEPETENLAVDPDVISDANHPLRVPTPYGPLIVFYKEDKTEGRVENINMLLTSEDLNVRSAAIKVLDEAPNEGLVCLSPRSQQVLGDNREDLLVSDKKIWPIAAIRIADALNDDICWAVRGLKQCLDCPFNMDELLAKFVSQVLAPSISSLESIKLDVVNPEKDHDGLERIIHQIVNESSCLKEACREYHIRLGYIPLARQYCMARLVSEWLLKNPETDAWAEVVEWSEGEASPLSNYHLCTVFVSLPELIPDGGMKELWELIIVSLPLDVKESSGKHNIIKWEIRTKLARHYAYHIEAHATESEGGAIAAFSWWLTEQVAILFPDNKDALDYYLKEWVKPALEKSGVIWAASMPTIEPSFGRYSTHSLHTQWSGSLLALMGPHFDKLVSEEIPEETIKHFHASILNHAVASINLFTTSSDNPTYALEQSLSEVSQKWLKMVTGDEKLQVEQLMNASKEWGTRNKLVKVMHNLQEMNLVDQFAVGLSFKAAVYISPDFGSELWELVSDHKWRKDVFGKVEIRVFAMLLESFLIVQVSRGEEWNNLFPHYIAELCELEEVEERRRQLFTYVSLTSLASNTDSAMKRLLRGKNQGVFHKYAEDLKAHIGGLWLDYPQWTHGKLRALLAVCR